MPATISGSQTGTVGLINTFTAINSTSGTSIDFTGIPSGVRRVTVVFNDVSQTGAGGGYLVQIGSGSFVATGYTSTVAFIASTNTVNQQTSTSGFICTNISAGTNTNGMYVLALVGSNKWVMQVNMAGGGWNIVGAGTSPTLAGALDRIRVTTTTGTDTFDAGSINVLYE